MRIMRRPLVKHVELGGGGTVGPDQATARIVAPGCFTGWAWARDGRHVTVTSPGGKRYRFRAYQPGGMAGELLGR